MRFNPQMFSTAMKLLPLLCLCLLTRSGTTFALEQGSGVVRVVVKEGSDAILPCSLSTKENIEYKLFDWKKDGQKEVFFFSSGSHYNKGRMGQDQQFKGRVSHFQDELKYGNASIIIRDTKVADSGDYSCIFPHLEPRQTFSIQLVVGASPKPSINTLYQTKDGIVLQCDVRGASPKPTVEWQDSAGNKLPAEEPQVSERGGSYYISLNTTVKKTDRYHCVATQEEINHQIDAEINVFISEKPVEDTYSRGEATGWFSGGIVLGAVILAVILVLLLATKRITVRWNKEAAEQRQENRGDYMMTSTTEPELESNSPPGSGVQTNGYH